MSFLVVAEQDLAAIGQEAGQALDAAGQAALASVKELAGYVDNVLVQDIEPQLLSALLAAIEKLGQDAVAALLGNGSSSASTTAAGTTSS